MAEGGVDDLDLQEAADWLDDKGIQYDHLESLEEMIELIKRRIHDDTGDHHDLDTSVSDVHPTTHIHGVMDSQEMMREILVRDHQMKMCLSEVYQDLLSFVKGEQMDAGIHEVVSKVYGDFDATLVSFRSQLVNDECPIVVAGETSAGKSSLLNLLLGTDVLPHSLLCATATICRLHNSDTKEFVITDNQRSRTITGDTNDSLCEKLRQYVSSEECRQDHKYKQVDIYWPIPMLQDKVTIVDTPGIGESDEMTKRLMDYLPNAVAFIYVINSAIAGGVQSDRLLHILKEQRQWETEGKLGGFDRSCTIFVCNKWDQVEKREEKEVMGDTLEKLRNVLPELQENQVFKMSTTKAARYMKSGMRHTEEFQALLDGIKRLVPASLEAKIKLHYRWLEKFMFKLQLTISSRVNNAHATEEEKLKLQQNVLQRLNKLRMDSDRVQTNLIKEAEIECNKIAESLYEYLKQDDFKVRMLTWRDSEAPNMGSGDLEVTKFNADKIILDRINVEIVAWERSSHMIKDLSERLTRRFCIECDLLGQACSEIDLVIDDSTASLNEADTRQTAGTKPVRNFPIFTASEKAVLVVAAPLWLPLVTAASILFLPVGIGMLIKESIKGVQDKKKYTEKKAVYMKKWTQLLLDAICKKETIKTFIFNTYFAEFKLKIHDVCDKFIPNQIAADEKQVHMIANDRRQSKEILQQYLPLQRGLKGVMSKLLYFRLRFISEELIPLCNIQKEKLIGKGNFSDVFLVTWQKEDKAMQAALKELRRPLKGDNIYSQLTEVECQRKLKHQNIVEFYGVTYTSQSEQATHEPVGGVDESPRSMSPDGGNLMLLLEYCDTSLEMMVFNKPHLQCRTYNSIQSRKETFQFYIDMATGICDGVAYIHANQYLHRDIKLSNVLVKNSTAKICDLGFARMDSAMTGTFVGTITHMAPEVFENKPYNVAVDVYSLGVLLWELWYGKHAYSEELFKSYSMPQLLDVIKSGTRPIMDGQSQEYKYQPMEELKQLIKDCWGKVPGDRPTAVSVRDRLQRIYEKYYQGTSNGC